MTGDQPIFRKSSFGFRDLWIVILIFLQMLSWESGAQDSLSFVPYASYWFPIELLEWDPLRDEHAKFNVSREPLAERFVQSGQILSEPVPGITALIASHPTSAHPSQGFDSVTQYVFPFWSYLDYFVQWGGSSYEGLIITPTVPWIDAAHRNGVPALGTVFFPPNVYGGKEQWVRDLLMQNPDGTFPLADKLIEVAELYGFDGWFINQETHGMNESDARLMVSWLKYFQQKARGQFKIMWYDSMLDDGRVIWQEELNEHNQVFFESEGRASDIMFLDFGWHAVNLEDTRHKAQELGRSPWEIYAGIDVQSRSYRTYANWDALYTENGDLKNTSIALYWPNSTFDIAKSKRPEDVYVEEMRFWNGTTVEFKERNLTYEWKGFTDYLDPRSTVTELPFVTRFNYGTGYHFNINGKRVTTKQWHNLSNQDILPHWQWSTDSTQVSPQFDFSESYNGGTSLRFDLATGNFQTVIPLYKTALPISQDTEFNVTSKMASPGEAFVQLSFKTTDTVEIELPQGQQWETKELNLARFEGKVIEGIAIKVRGTTSDHRFWLGEIAIVDGRLVKPGKPKGTLNVLGGGSAHLHIDNLPAEIWYYDIYQQTGKQKTWVKRSSSSDIFLSNLDEKVNRIEVVPVNRNGTSGPPLSLKF